MKEFLNNKKGVSLIEIMLAVAVFVVSIVTVAHLFIGAQEASVFSMQKNQAISLAKEGLEAVRSIPYSDIEEEYGEFIEGDANSLVFRGTLDRVGTVEDVEVWFQWGVPGEDLVMEEVSETFENTSTGSSGTMQTWTAPYSGEYTITAYGAGNTDQGRGSAEGAVIQGVFEIEEGETFDIVVGQEGFNNGNSGGGGGGSFVVRNSDDEPFIVAGGAGGHTGRALTATSGSNTGSPGYGGPSQADCAGGGGFVTDGSSSGGMAGGSSFLNGAEGGGNQQEGGFGGGGDGRTSCCRNGGGGGYSGGSGHTTNAGGYGGGSFISSKAIDAATSDGSFSTTGGELHAFYNGEVGDLNTWNESHGLVTIEGEGWDLDAEEENLTETTPVMENPPSSFSETIQLDPEEIPQEVYIYRAVAIDLENNQAHHGEIKTIETGITNFAVNTKDATDIDENSATIRGEILSMGIANSADVWLDYGTEESLGEGPVGEVNMSETGEFSFELTGLEEDTEYYFQAQGENAAGEVDEGEIMSFAAQRVEINETFENTSTGRDGEIQTWTVPATWTYRITAYGAQGGMGNNPGGKGAKISGEFALNEGDKLEILVGQQANSTSASSGGGGGTFVVAEEGDSEEDILVIAGGGGGSGNDSDSGSYGVDAAADTRGTLDGHGNGERAENGEGGRAGDFIDGGNSGNGGGGFLTNGESGDGASEARSFLNGGIGGNGSEADGGFGGGAGHSSHSNQAGSAGGGYSGGQGGGRQTGRAGGGGGGSYNNGENQENESGTNEGHGLVTIESVN